MGSGISPCSQPRSVGSAWASHVEQRTTATSSVPTSVTTLCWQRDWPLQGNESQSLSLLHPSRRAVSATFVTSSSSLSPRHSHGQV